MKSCAVFIGKEIVGHISETETGFRFRYCKEWIKNGGKELSQSLPLDNSFSDEAGTSFFLNMLPEGVRLNRIASMTRIRVSHLVDWLSAYGEDLPGNISVFSGNEKREKRNITSRIESLIENGHSLDTLRERLSLAGIEAKTAVIAFQRNGIWQFFSPDSENPSTHILKQAPELCILESMCMRILDFSGMETSKTQLIAIAETPVLLVRRYDRELENGKWKKLPQEDFCQILGKSAEEKYWIDETHGIGNAHMLSVMNTLPEEDMEKFLKLSCASLVLGNNDDHAKNYSVIHFPEGSRLAPAYDVTSAVAAKKYVEACRYITTRLSRPFGGEIEPSKITPEHIVAHGIFFGCNAYPDLWMETVENLKQAIVPAVESVVEEAKKDAFGPKQIRKIENFALLLPRILLERSKRFLRLGKNAKDLNTKSTQVLQM